MTAVVYKAPFQVAVEEVPEPRIEAPGDAIIKGKSTNICGSERQLRDLIIAGLASPSLLISHNFDRRAEGYTKVISHPERRAA